MDSHFNDPLERFATMAVVYCGLIEAYRTQSPEQFLATVQPVIASLYAAGLSLPTLPEPNDEEGENEEADDAAPSWVASSAGFGAQDGNRIPHDEWWSLYKGLSSYLGSRNDYREIFDPYEPVSKAEVTASLADDLADIYRDLLGGHRKWARGERTNAHWEWRFGLENHWGEHATGAIRAIHCLMAWHELPWPESTGAV
jgi:hypothetical protein